MRPALFFVICAEMLRAGCIPVTGSKILARDLTGSVPMLGALDPEAVIGFAPLPGVQRTLSGRELLRWMQRNGLGADDTPPDVCVQRATRPIDPAELLRALKTALGIEDARVELLDFSHENVSSGHSEFSPSALNRPPEKAPETPVIWRGRWIYDDERSLAVWAKVRITVDRPAVFAAAQIPAGASIRADELTLRQAPQFPFSIASLSSISQVAGKLARRTILAGQRLAPECITDVRDVRQGDTIRVRVVDGLASLSLDAVAESTGSKGDVVIVRNPMSGKNFRAEVEDKGKVVVRSSEEIK